MSDAENIFVGVWGFRNGNPVIGGDGVNDHADLLNVTPDQHHDQVHDIDGADHTFPGGAGTTYLNDQGGFTVPPGAPGTGDVTGPAGAGDDLVACFDGGTGKLIKAGTITCTAIAAHVASTFNPHDTSLNNLGGSNLAALNALVSDATLDTNTASRPPNGLAGGSLTGSFPNPGVADGADSTAIHDNIPGEIIAIPVKAIPVGTDVLVIEDSAAADAKKHIRIGDLPAAAPAVHAIDGALHSFPAGGGTTYLDDDGNFTTPAGGAGDVIQIGAPVEDESVAVYDDTTGKKIKGGGPVATSIVTRDTTTSLVDEVAVFTDTASKVITGSGIRMIGGALCYSLKNGTGLAVAVGSVMEVDPGTADSVQLAGANTSTYAGICAELSGALATDLVWMAISGEATVRCDAGAIAIGEHIDSAGGGFGHTHGFATGNAFCVATTSKGAGAGPVQAVMVAKAANGDMQSQLPSISIPNQIPKYPGTDAHLVGVSGLFAFGDCLTIALENKTGGSVPLGTVMITALGTDSAVVLGTQAGQDRFAGIAMDVSALDGDPTYCGMLGAALVNCTAAAVTRGDYLAISATPGLAFSTGTAASSGDFGVALSGKGAGLGQVIVLLRGMEVF